MKDKIKVLLVSPYSAKKIGGIGTWSKSVVDAFDESENVCILFQNTKSFLKFTPKSVVGHLFKGVTDTATILIKLFMNCLFKKPSVIHYTSSASWALRKDLIAIRIARLFKIPFVIHWHFGRIPEIFKEKGTEYNHLKRVSCLVSKSIAIDKSSYEALKQDGVENACYIPNALPDNVLDASEKAEESARENNMVLFVGHVIKTKGVYELVRSCTRIAEVHRLLIAGPYSEEVRSDLILIAQSRDNGRWLHFLGEITREEVFDYYRKCAIFALPSYTEGFPYVILEAMAFGCPIIATEVGAIPQLITSSTGILVPARDEERLTNAIDLLINDKQKASELGKNAKQEVTLNYSTKSVMKQYEQVWVQICQEKKR